MHVLITRTSWKVTVIAGIHIWVVFIMSEEIFLFEPPPPPICILLIKSWVWTIHYHSFVLGLLMLSAKAQGPIYDLGPYPYRFYLAYSFLFGPYGPNLSYLVHSTQVTIAFEWNLWCVFVLKLLSLSLVYVFVSKKKKTIQSIWSYSVHFGPIQSIQYTLTLFGPYWSYSIHFGHIQSTLVHYLSYSVHYVHFNPLGPIWSILSTLVLFGPLCPLQSYSVHIGPIRSSMSTSILFGPFLSILSTLFLFGPLQSYSIHLVSISSILSIWSNSVHLITSILFCPLQSIFVHLQNGKRHI